MYRGTFPPLTSSVDPPGLSRIYTVVAGGLTQVLGLGKVKRELEAYVPPWLADPRTAVWTAFGPRRGEGVRDGLVYLL